MSKEIVDFECILHILRWNILLDFIDSCILRDICSNAVSYSEKSSKKDEKIWTVSYWFRTLLTKLKEFHILSTSQIKNVILTSLKLVFTYEESLLWQSYYYDNC